VANPFTTQVFHYAAQKNIELFVFPPPLTHQLQPCDVGMFSLYKHWHQQILYRAISGGTSNFGKSNFLAHLEEARNRTFKESVIIKAAEVRYLSF
jgi:hypothetical protein